MTNQLYLAVLPLIPLNWNWLKPAETLTLFPDESFATRFFPDEVDEYIAAFERTQSLLTGGHVQGYQLSKQVLPDGRVIVQVVQHVA